MATADGRVAFAFIAFGPSALRPFVEYAVGSLRRVGGYRGDVFVFTDHPECYAYSAESEAGQGRTRVVALASPETSLEQSLRNPRYQRTLFRMTKTELLRLVPSDYEYVVFLDSDIVTTQENCVDDFLRRNIVDPGWGPEMAIRAQWEPGLFVHLGSFILRRRASEALLDEWRDAFTKDDYLDRISFMRAVGKRLGLTRDQWNTDDAGVVERRAAIVGSLANGDAFLRPVSEVGGGEPGSRVFVTPTCFTHISGARCDAYGKPFVDGVLSEFLSDYALDYCRDTTSWRGWALFKLERLGMTTDHSCAHRAPLSAVVAQEDALLMRLACGCATMVALLCIALYLGVYRPIAARHKARPKASFAKAG